MARKAPKFESGHIWGVSWRLQYIKEWSCDFYVCQVTCKCEKKKTVSIAWKTQLMRTWKLFLRYMGVFAKFTCFHWPHFQFTISVCAIWRVMKMQLENYSFLWHSCIFLDRTVAINCNRKRVEEKERDEIRKGPQGGIWTWDTWSATAPYVGTLPTRLSAPAETHLFSDSFVVVNRPLMGKIIHFGLFVMQSNEI